MHVRNSGFVILVSQGYCLDRILLWKVPIVVYQSCWRLARVLGAAFCTSGLNCNCMFFVSCLCTRVCGCVSFGIYCIAVDSDLCTSVYNHSIFVCVWLFLLVGNFVPGHQSAFIVSQDFHFMLLRKVKCVGVYYYCQHRDMNVSTKLCKPRQNCLWIL